MRKSSKPVTLALWIALAVAERPAANGARWEDPAGKYVLKAFTGAYERQDRPIVGGFGSGLFDASLSFLPASQVYGKTALNDSRGLLDDGNLAPGYRGLLGKSPFHPMAIAAVDVNADGHDDVLALDAVADYGWSDSVRFLMFPAAGNGAFLEPTATRLSGRYADMIRLLESPKAVALMRRSGEEYTLEVHFLASLACGQGECPAPSPAQSIKLPGTPTNVITGDFNLDHVSDIAVSLKGHPGRILVLKGAPGGLSFPESGRKTLVPEDLVPLRTQIVQNRLGHARSMAAGIFRGGTGEPDANPDLVIATFDSANWWQLEIFHDFAVAERPRRQTLDWIPHEQYVYQSLMFTDVDGDGREDFVDMRPEGSSPLPKTACCLGGGGMARLDMNVRLARSGGGYAQPIPMSAYGQEPLGLTPLPHDPKQTPHPLFAVAFETDGPTHLSPYVKPYPAGVSIFEYNPLYNQGVFGKGTLRGGPFSDLQHELVPMDKGKRLLYAVGKSTTDAHGGGIGTIAVEDYLRFFASPVGMTPRAGRGPAGPGAFGAAEFLRGGIISDALGRLRRAEAKAPARERRLN